jgi:hypothetical protein
VILVAALVAAQGAMSPLQAADEAPPPARPQIMLCVYGADGAIVTGNVKCPPRAKPADDMMPAAHCFYDTSGQLWRGLPRCPRTAPAFLMEDADQMPR